ncbi:hypothetical protein QJ133_04225 [Priestia megaterium]|uniref:hypothetical protein n=1 Tax=Priestia megaterium TaxID=1404 RepID=UPI00249A1C7A|nr:hypothetical protein [Priestia megaterium]MDI3090372.1 hypothetical protein [Priestia megaterium]
MENIKVEQISDNELKLILPGGINCTSQKTRDISKDGNNKAEDIKVEKISDKELKLILPAGMNSTADKMTIEELYHGLTDALVPAPHRPRGSGFCLINF